MPTAPEKEPVSSPPEDVTEIPEEISTHIETDGVKKRPTQITTVVSDDSGKPLTQSQQTKTTSIKLPTDEPTLQRWSKGSVSDSLTWFASFWLRTIKRAIHAGIGVITGQGKN